MQDPAWQQHAKFFDAAFGQLEQRQLAKIRGWAAVNLSAPRPSMFYMFSGPDFLYADAFYSKATTYVLSALEPVGKVPDLTKVPRGSIGSNLYDIEQSLGSILSFSFFITKEMKTDLQAGPISGTLPLLYVFLARSGKTIREVSLVALDDKGTTYRKLILDKYPDLDINFVHHAGNSSGVVDGSAAILLASPSYTKAHGLKPRARVVAMATAGVAPRIMGMGPVPASRKALVCASSLAISQRYTFATAAVTRRLPRGRGPTILHPSARGRALRGSPSEGRCRDRQDRTQAAHQCADGSQQDAGNPQLPPRAPEAERRPGSADRQWQGAGGGRRPGDAAALRVAQRLATQRP